MPSKKRAGLSKREFAAQAKMKAAPKQRVSTPAVTKNKYGQNVASPSEIARIKAYQSNLQSGINPDVSAYAEQDLASSKLSRMAQANNPNEQRIIANKKKSNNNSSNKKISSKPSSRSLASQAFNNTFGVPTAQAADYSPEDTTQETPKIDYNNVSLTPTTTKNTAGAIFNKGTDWLRQSAPLGISGLLQGMSAAGIDLSKSLGIDKYLRKDSGLANFTNDQGQVLGVQDQMDLGDFQKVKESDPYADANDYMQKRQNNRNQIASNNFAPYASSDYTRVVSNKPQDNYNVPEDFFTPVPDNYDYSQSPENQFVLQDIVDNGSQEQQILDNVASGITPDIADQFAGTQTGGGTVRRLFGSGAFGNGAMVGNPAGLSKEEKAYIKDLRRSLGGDYGASNVQSQFDELINALNSAYDLQQQNATNELNQAKNEDINKLRAMFAGNNTAGSEQQQQYVQRTQGDYATQLANLLAKLAASKNEQVAKYRSDMQGQLANIDQSKRTAQQRVADMILQVQQNAQSRAERAQQQALDNQYKMASLAGRGGQTLTQRQKALESLLTRASKMSSGGREWAQKVAKSQGLGDISQYTPNGWEGMYNPNFGQPQGKNLVSIGNGYILDKDTGDVYQGY